MTVYLYGFTKPGGEPPPPDLLGVAGAPVRVLDLGEVRAAVSDVPSGDFAEDVLQERVRDLEWVSEQGALHERVVTWFVDHGTVLPARFLTLHSDEEALRESLEDRAGALAERLSALDGLAEWDLKVSLREERFRERMGDVSTAVAELDRRIGEAAPGKRYLLERKRDRLAREEESRAARQVAREAWDEAERHARHSRRLTPPAGWDRDFPVVLNGAFLIPRSDEAEVARRIGDVRERLAPLGLDVEFTGPWAPYRFAGEAGEGGGP